jgi:hypothetical protein
MLPLSRLLLDEFQPLELAASLFFPQLNLTHPQMAPLNKGQIVGITLGSTVGGIILVVVLSYSLYALRSAIWAALTVFEQRYGWWYL